jgi:hypothetical protein
MVRADQVKQDDGQDPFLDHGDVYGDGGGYDGGGYEEDDNDTTRYDVGEHHGAYDDPQPQFGGYDDVDEPGGGDDFTEQQEPMPAAEKVNTTDGPQVLRCMAGLPQTRELIGLKIPYGAWEPDTLITDTFGNPMFSVLDVQHHAMGAYEAIFGDENGHKLCYVKRRLITNYYNDGWDFCTYRPNFPGQPRYKERDMYGSKL